MEETPGGGVNLGPERASRASRRRQRARRQEEAPAKDVPHNPDAPDAQAPAQDLPHGPDALSLDDYFQVGAAFLDEHFGTAGERDEDSSDEGEAFQLSPRITFQITYDFCYCGQQLRFCTHSMRVCGV